MLSKYRQKDKSHSIMLYSHDGFGLGHIRRNYLIARRGVTDIINSQYLLITGSVVPPFSYLPQGIDYIKLPSIIKVDNGHWTARTLPIEPEEFKKLRASMILETAKIFQPDVFIVDYTPSGIWYELIPTFELLKRGNGSTKIVLGLRDILDTPGHTRDFWEAEGVYDVLKEFYDRILIYGCRELFHTASHYGLQEKLGDRIFYCGYLCSQEPKNSKDMLRKRLGLKKEKLILITAGGGYDAYPMMQLSMRALREVFKKVTAEALFITGPLMNPESYEVLVSQAKDLPIHIIRFDDTINYINTADLVVTMAGYNTLMDAVYARQNIIVIPRKGPSAEQTMRAEIFDKLGLVTSLKPADQVSSGDLAEVMIERLHHPLASDISIDLDGLGGAVRKINQLLTERCELLPVYSNNKP